MVSTQTLSFSVHLLLTLLPRLLGTAACDNPLVFEKSPGSITFKATSNDVKATKNTYQGTQLTEVIKSSKVFKDAFSTESEESDPWDAAFETESKKPDLRVRRIDVADEAPAGVIIQSSKCEESVYPAASGLVSAATAAYNNHHNLVLRPDDVWQSILTQFSFYVNARDGELRDSFVDFKGKKTLVAEMDGTLFTADYATLAELMVDNISANLKDKDVTEWLLPNFSTTTSDDRVAASVSVMSTLKSYFKYVFYLMCGIPQVTLMGTLEDWQLLRQKIDRLPKYNLEDKLMTKWHALLSSVLDEFVKAAACNPSLAFWDTICSHHGGGSGPSYLSGWITVFGVFTGDGKWQGNVRERSPDSWFVDDEGAEHMVETISSVSYVNRSFSAVTKPLWPFIDSHHIPVGASSAPVLVDDNGVQYNTHLMGGQFAYEMTNQSTTVRPRSDWCLAYGGKPKAKQEGYKNGEIIVE